MGCSICFATTNIYIYIYIYIIKCAKGVTCSLTRDDIWCFEYLQYTTLHLEHVDLSPVIPTYQSISSIFIKFLYCLENEQRFYLYLSIFSNTLSNRFSISFSISFKYYFFIYSLFFFNNYTSSNIFLIQHLIIIIEKSHLKNEQ